MFANLCVSFINFVVSSAFLFTNVHVRLACCSFGVKMSFIYVMNNLQFTTVYYCIYLHVHVHV